MKLPLILLALVLALVPALSEAGYSGGGYRGGGSYGRSYSSPSYRSTPSYKPSTRPAPSYKVTPPASKPAPARAPLASSPPKAKTSNTFSHSDNSIGTNPFFYLWLFSMTSNSSPTSAGTGASGVPALKTPPTKLSCADFKLPEDCAEVRRAAMSKVLQP